MSDSSMVHWSQNLTLQYTWLPGVKTLHSNPDATTTLHASYMRWRPRLPTSNMTRLAVATATVGPISVLAPHLVCVRGSLQPSRMHAIWPRPIFTAPPLRSTTVNEHLRGAQPDRLHATAVAMR